jgi:hypothetical protein
MKQSDMFEQYLKNERDEEKVKKELTSVAINNFKEKWEKEDKLRDNKDPIEIRRDMEEDNWLKRSDPNPHIPGAKLDSNKPDLDLVLGDFAKALQEVGKIGTFGAKKYTEHGWLSVSNGQRRYSSAMWRHIFQYKEGDELDNESGFSHLAHAAWNALAVLELYLRNNK